MPCAPPGQASTRTGSVRACLGPRRQVFLTSPPTTEALSMRPPIRFLPLLPASLVAAAGAVTFGVVLCMAPAGDVLQKETPAPAGTPPRPQGVWRVEDVKPGMRGYGRTVMKGTAVESFDAEVIGVLKNTSPGRDLVLCRLAGLDLERSGIIAGMSGSPVYINNKLLGAVAYGWAY